MRTFSDMAQDLRELSTVDWSTVWPGYAHADPMTWCAQHGWRLVQLDREENLNVGLRSGGQIYLSQDRRTLTVTSAELDYWRAEAQRPDENPALFTAAQAAWSQYMTGATSAVRPPDLVTSYDDPAFPDLPGWTPGERAARRPLRLAVWRLTGAAAQLPISPSDEASTSEPPGSIHIALLLRPADPAEPRGGA